MSTEEIFLRLFGFYNSRIYKPYFWWDQTIHKNIKAVTDWETPKNVRHVQSFLGFTNCYRRFIRDYSSIVSPLYKLTEKGSTFYWSIECNQAFMTLKKCLTTAPLLVTPRTGPNESFVISTGASNKGIGAVLLQEQPDGSLRPCSY
jgi:hypothetical protein